MSSRLAYRYPEWVHEAWYLEGYNILEFHHYNREGCPRRHLIRFLVQCNNLVFSHALLQKQFPLSLSGAAEYWLYTLRWSSIANRDVAKRFYQTFYMCQPIRPDTRVWDEGMGNEAMLLAFQTPQGESPDNMINNLLNLKPFSSMRLRNLHPKRVYIAPFLPAYRLPKFIFTGGIPAPCNTCKSLSDNVAMLVFWSNSSYPKGNRLWLVSYSAWVNNLDMGGHGRTISQETYDLPT